MKKNIQSLFAVILVGLVLASCESENPLITPIKNSITITNYQAAVDYADSALMKEPENATAYYYRAVALGQLAQTNADITARKSTYEEMRENFMTAREIYSTQEEPASESNDITNAILEFWSVEHNEGITYATDDSVMAMVDEPLGLAIAHLENAVTINPDSVLSWDVLAQIYYMDEQPAKAAEAITTAIALQDIPAALDYDRLASYYFLSEEPAKAVTAIEEGLKLYPDSVSLVQKLADGLFQLERSEEAMEVMQQLIDSEPENPLYRLVVGTRIYQRVLALSDQYAKNNDQLFELRRNDGSEEEIAALEEEDKRLLERIDELTATAEEALQAAAELDPTNASVFNTLGILYQNKSAALFEQRNATDDNDEAARLDELAKEELRVAMEYYEKAAELEPENQNYWGSLFRIYTTLGMNDKAEEAMEKAGM